MCNHRNPLHCIVPPHILEHMAEHSPDARVRSYALKSLDPSAALRTVRSVTHLPSASVRSTFGLTSAAAQPRRMVYDMRNGNPQGPSMPGTLVRSEGDAPVKDDAVNQAYDGAGDTFQFYLTVFQRNSLDDRGMPIISSVHCGDHWNNAFWNGSQMAYGDGDGIVFQPLTGDLDVIGHELTHGVESHESNLEYQGESGALNEHFADAFGSMVKQWKLGQSVTAADWLIGGDIVVPGPTRRALRDMRNPGTAYQNDPHLGDDPQPASMSDPKFYRGTQDNGGVHINSGVPNRAFAEAAIAVGGNSWGPVGEVWYAAVKALTSRAQFADMAKTTRSIARANQPTAVYAAIDGAWTLVGL
ncbi:MAG TPA: M4 family metallopeptidase [Fimbriimonadaceae bacterium]|nr:M4 family metallopeptidase [Fimbriimonadaceae bacterium]